MMKIKRRNQILKAIQEVLSKFNLTVEEAIEAYGMLGYNLGASIAGYKEKGPTLEELKQYYYTDPTIDISLMLQGLTTITWIEDWKKSPRLFNQKREKKDE